ncbi:S8 family peptidase [Bacillus mojavensis]|uniref:S8 family peptidase n=1 Tax=Bacillus mojavensis TaxID=72360 RepID=UPI002DBE82B5|nr:S8 family peptidase [Bacillus mojavensis]MEC1738480.1 S8 family peptidase [Bacillus mojavensis]MEC1795172.1 S8 family peptidase [Bacillus mojavensis]
MIFISILSIIILLFFVDLNQSQGSKELRKKGQESKEYKTHQVESWGLRLIGKNKKIEKKSNISIAILDSGIDSNHEDLKGVVKKEYNALEPSEGVIEDKFGHGTAVAGIIASNDNKIGTLGIAPYADIYSVKVLDDKGRGSAESIVKGIEWSIDNNVDIVNISVGLKKNDQNLKRVIDEANEKGVIVVAAAGNNYGLNADYPARYQNVISVGAINKKKKRAKYSARGKIDFVAPGEDLHTTSPKNKYTNVSGTSMATPFVSGTVANIIMEEPDKYNKNKSRYSRIYNKLKEYSTYNFSKYSDIKSLGNGVISFKEGDK